MISRITVQLSVIYISTLKDRASQLLLKYKSGEWSSRNAIFLRKVLLNQPKKQAAEKVKNVYEVDVAEVVKS